MAQAVVTDSAAPPDRAGSEAGLSMTDELMDGLTPLGKYLHRDLDDPSIKEASPGSGLKNHIRSADHYRE